MIRRYIVFTLILAFSSTGMAAVCLLNGATQIPANSTFAIGPNLNGFVANNAAMGTAIYAGRDAWDVTDAVDRIGNWNNVVSASDCPAGLPGQIGAFGFAGSTCATLLATIPNADDRGRTLAFVDYYASNCPQCGTKSLSFNLNFTWSTNPLAGQYDIQSVTAHEMGHILGFAHQDNGECNTLTSPTCATTPDRETMGAQTPDASTCMRDVAPNDRQSANNLY